MKPITKPFVTKKQISPWILTMQPGCWQARRTSKPEQKRKKRKKRRSTRNTKKTSMIKKKKTRRRKKTRTGVTNKKKIRPEEPTKRVREEEPTRNVQKTKTKRAPSPHLEPIRDHPIVASQDEILELRSEIEQIMSDNQPSLIELRQALIKLSRLVVDIHLLRSTRIAHLLTKIVRTPSLSRLHALCRALLVSWIGKLPEDMRNALRWVNQSQNEFVAQPSMVSLGSDSQVNQRTARCENFKTYVVDPDIAVAIDDAITNIPNDPQLSRRLVAALKKNKQLCDDLRDRKLAVEDFVKMTPAELMNSEEKAMAEMKRQQTLELRTQQSQGSVTQVTNKYPCTECRNEKCSFNEVQMRGADEPATIFLMCLACGHTFTPDD
eukprot:PhF_6_TR35732/c0_g1_i1/m.51885